MAGTKRPAARIEGASIASDVIAKLGREIWSGRQRRRLHQQTLANRVGISRALLAKMEAGHATGTPPEVWFAVAVALDRYLKLEFARDPLLELADAGHADIQELVLSIAKPCGYRGGFELRTRNIGRPVETCFGGLMVMRQAVRFVRVGFGIACLITLSGCVTVVTPPPTQQEPTVGPTASTAIEPTAQPTLEPTTEPTPSTGPTPTAEPTAPAGSLPPVIFSDDFGGATRFLSRGVQEGFGGSEYADGVYRVTAEPREGFVNYQGGGSRSGCSGTDCDFPDEIHGDILSATVEVDVTQVSGALDGGFGIACAYEGTGTLGRFVGLTISADGRRYAVAMNSAPGDVPIDQLIGGADRGDPNPLVAGDLGVTHRLRADCGEEVFNLWVDGALVASGRLSEPFGPPSFERGIGLVAAPGPDGAVEVEFDNLVVSELAAEPEFVPEPARAIYIDPLSSESPAWTVGEYEVGSVGFEEGAYVVRPTVGNRAAVFPTTMVPPIDVVVQVDVELDAAPELASVGVQCRASSTGWYAAEIRADGTFSIAHESRFLTTRLIDWTATDAIHLDGTANTMRLACIGDKVTFTVNEEQVGDVTNSEVTDVGGAGVQATSPADAADDEAVVARFTNYVVSHP